MYTLDYRFEEEERSLINSKGHCCCDCISIRLGFYSKRFHILTLNDDSSYPFMPAMEPTARDAIGYAEYLFREVDCYKLKKDRWKVVFVRPTPRRKATSPFPELIWPIGEAIAAYSSWGINTADELINIWESGISQAYWEKAGKYSEWGKIDRTKEEKSESKSFDLLNCSDVYFQSCVLSILSLDFLKRLEAGEEREDNGKTLLAVGKAIHNKLTPQFNFLVRRDDRDIESEKKKYYDNVDRYMQSASSGLVSCNQAGDLIEASILHMSCRWNEISARKMMEEAERRWKDG